MAAAEEIDNFLRECFADDLACFPVLSPAALPASASAGNEFSRSTKTSGIHVTLTYAQSLDAKIAGEGGKQLILSGKESMAMTHRQVALDPASLPIRLNNCLCTVSGYEPFILLFSLASVPY